MIPSSRFSALFALFLLFPFAVLALDVPTPQGYVTDIAGLLTAQERMDLEAKISNIESNTSIEIAILILPSLEEENLEEYATRVFRQWGVGKKDVDNGVLILVAQKERQIRIETGYGVEGAVTDITSGLIIRERIAPNFLVGQYARGLSSAVEDIAGLVQADPGVISRYSDSAPYQSYGISLAEILSIFVLSVSYLIVVAYASYKFPKGNSLRLKMKAGGFATVSVLSLVLALFFGSLVFWATIFICVWLLSASGGGPIILGGFGGGGWGGGGSFGGFGGGSSGGGGASGGW